VTGGGTREKLVGGGGGAGLPPKELRGGTVDEEEEEVSTDPAEEDAGPKVEVDEEVEELVEVETVEVSWAVVPAELLE
jgi:hypothetical protein